MRLLLVEDDPSVRHLVDRLLTGQGYHVLAAGSADAASALLLDFPDPPDVGVLDIVLPGISGITFADELVARYPAMRFVFMTGWLQPSKIIEAESRGRLLLKPFAGRDLLSAVRGAVKAPVIA